MIYQVTKTYGHECGLSATFRQWKANSHCKFMHGYALSFKFTFECEAEHLDENGWVQDFGGLKPLKKWLEDTFDHKTLVAADDPALSLFRDMTKEGPLPLWGKPQLIQLVEVPHTGCEAFAYMAFNEASRMLNAGLLARTPGDTLRPVKLVEVEVREHGGNSAIYRRNP